MSNPYMTINWGLLGTGKPPIESGIRLLDEVGYYWGGLNTIIGGRRVGEWMEPASIVYTLDDLSEYCGFTISLRIASVDIFTIDYVEVDWNIIYQEIQRITGAELGSEDELWNIGMRLWWRENGAEAQNSRAQEVIKQILRENLDEIRIDTRGDN